MSADHPLRQLSPVEGEGILGRPQPVPWVANLQPAVHGSWEAGRAHGRTDSIIDFSANGNVIGPPPGVNEAIARASVDRYPERTSATLRKVIAQRHKVEPGMVVLGNGSTELIWAIARAFLAPGSLSLVLAPTYGEYATASRAAGADVKEVWWYTQDYLARTVSNTKPGVVWMCHPNNPTGAPFRTELLPALFKAAPRTLFVVDEAYWTLTDGLASALPYVASGHVAVVRSLTKDMGLAGLRVGYALGGPAVADVVQRALPPWNVSSVAQAAALAALDDTDHLTNARVSVAASRTHLAAGLRGLGLDPWPSTANFVLFRIGDAAAVTAELLTRGCAVRDCTSFGLPEFIRIGVRPLADQEMLLTTLAEVLEKDGLRPHPNPLDSVGGPFAPRAPWEGEGVYCG